MTAMENKIPQIEPNKKIIINIIFGSLLLIPVFLSIYIFLYIMSKETARDNGPQPAVVLNQESSASQDGQYWQRIQTQEADLRKTTGMSFEQTAHETQRQLDTLELKKTLRRYSNTLSDTLY